jgi:hypothetical protein
VGQSVGEYFSELEKTWDVIIRRETGFADEKWMELSDDPIHWRFLIFKIVELSVRQMECMHTGVDQGSSLWAGVYSGFQWVSFMYMMRYETCYVFFKVRTKFLNIIWRSFGFQG